MKTEKYFITSYLSDGIVAAQVEVSKTKFNTVYKDVMKQFNNQEKDSEFEVEMDTYFNDNEKFIEKVVSFSWSINSIDFKVITCKEGYAWKR